MQKRFKKSWLILATLAMLSVQSPAQIGWTLGQCEQHYGKQASKPVKDIDPGVTQYHFVFGKLDLYVRISSNTNLVTAMYYSKLDRGPISDAEIIRLLRQNGGDLSWVPVGGEQPPSADQKNWMGVRNAKTVLSASYRLMEEGEGYVLNITVGGGR